MMSYLIDNMGVETYHPSSFKHELTGGFPFWVFLMTLTPHRINEGIEMKEVPPEPASSIRRDARVTSTVWRARTG